ncbi:unnamed protein product [Pedinophyceae sp. YPF-701]|nr:unnamed protein product [Pedinophyceae sp. YPF-701]
MIASKAAAPRSDAPNAATAALFHRVLRETPLIVAGLGKRDLLSLAASSPPALETVLKHRVCCLEVTRFGPLLKLLAKHADPDGDYRSLLCYEPTGLMYVAPSEARRLLLAEARRALKSRFYNESVLPARVVETLSLLNASLETPRPLRVTRIKLCSGTYFCTASTREVAGTAAAVRQLMAHPTVKDSLTMVRACCFRSNLRALDPFGGAFTPPLDTFEFDECCLAGQEAWLADSLRSFAVKSLVLGSCSLYGNGVGVVLQALRTTARHMVVLDLDCNPFGDVGARELASALGALERLERLQVGSCHIRPEGVRVLAAAVKAHPALQRLAVSHNHVGHAGVVALRTAVVGCGTLSNLELNDAQIGEGESLMLTGILLQGSLKQLSLAFNHLGDVGAAAVAKALVRNTSLERLNLTKTGVGDDAACLFGDAIQAHPRLQELDLKANEITDRGAKGLAAGLAGARPSTCLRLLQLDVNDIGGDGMSAIQDAHRKNPALRHLEVSRSTMTIVEQVAAMAW